MTLPPATLPRGPTGHPAGHPTRRRRKRRRRPADPRLQFATCALRSWRPELSAAEPIWPSQKVAILIAAAVLGAAIVLLEGRLGPALSWLLVLPFLASAVVRIGALRQLGGRTPRRRAKASPLPDAALPSYTIMVPLYREAEVVPQMVGGLLGLDYPTDRLQVLLVVEAVDAETQAAFRAITLPAHMNVVVVPKGEPKTKPRAINYALTEATGDLVVVYDAEDLPERDQLRRAAAAFARDPSLGCVQARLNIYNAEESWLSRQFTMEYTALFDALLPLLARLGWPVPLGGTSNHFRRRVLVGCGAWDPYNVTEDADLGIRLARLGTRVGVLDSTTWEEAPTEFRIWYGQRTRWIKGWMQTWLVHMRQPLRLRRELGTWSFIGLQIWTAAVLVSSLVHPWFYLVMLWDAWSWHSWGGRPDDLASQTLWTLAIVNMLAGYGSAMALGSRVLARRRLRMAATVWTLPIYWLAVSFAAHRAALELITAPFHWEKTKHRAAAVHGGRRHAALPAAAAPATGSPSTRQPRIRRWPAQG